VTGHLDEIRSAVHDVNAHHSLGQQAPGTVNTPLWRELDQLGFTAIAVPTELGGSGGDLCDAAAAIEAAALAQIPIGEAALIAGAVLSAAGVKWPGGIVTAAPAPHVGFAEGQLWGKVERIPWLRGADLAVLVLDDAAGSVVAALSPCSAGVSMNHGLNLAGEARDDLTIAGVDPVHVASLPPGWSRRITQLGAICRTAQIAGAARQALKLTVAHVMAREQFGRPLAKFQVVQDQIASLAADVATVRLAAECAAIAWRDQRLDTGATVAAAKAQASSLAGSIAAISHQLHGALGFSEEHQLGRCTRRLWSWREEYGNELTWHQYLAGWLADSPDDLWQLVTGTAPMPAAASLPGNASQEASPHHDRTPQEGHDARAQR
jgi:acyl-CoA dehydrogenase